MENIRISVSECIALVNQTLEYAYPSVEIEGEVSGFKVNQGKYVFFDIKDESGSLGCFMTVWQLKAPIEDGMKVVVIATPKLTQWGKFSLTVREVRPSGEGAIKKSFQILKAKLDQEGLFEQARKRPLPVVPTRIALISSTQAAGYTDFITILNDRWGDVRIDVAHVQVQGSDAPDQIMRAIRYFNEQPILADVLAIVRGGGSADDLAAFNDERLVREIASSRIPTIVGVGHETDESLADLAADVRAATPSDAARRIAPDRRDMIRMIRMKTGRLGDVINRVIDDRHTYAARMLDDGVRSIEQSMGVFDHRIGKARQVLTQLNPETSLKRGYAIIRGDRSVGSTIEIETWNETMKAKVEEYERIKDR